MTISRPVWWIYRDSSVKRRIKLLFAWEEISEQGVAKKKTNRVWPRKKWNTYMHL